jgi:SAM-dependent methyltransferase
MQETFRRRSATKSCEKLMHTVHCGQMHPSSFDKMTAFRRDHLEARRQEPLVIIDLGSQDFNGSYRPLFALPPWQYLGVDLAPGANVDVVLADPYDWRELSPESADVIVAGQTFEHTEYFWETMRQMARTLKPNGICCIIVPSSGPEHRFPVDCWRMYPDGLRAVARYAGLEVIAAETQWEDLPEYDSESNKWHDSVLIARKA